MPSVSGQTVQISCSIHPDTLEINAVTRRLPTQVCHQPGRTGVLPHLRRIHATEHQLIPPVVAAEVSRYRTYHIILQAGTYQKPVVLDPYLILPGPASLVQPQTP